MGLTRLDVSGFRNIDNASLQLSAGINLLHGANGSGKTSLLEAVHFLGSARSFRTVSADALVKHGQSHCLVRGEVSNSAGHFRIGVQRTRRSEREIRINGESCLKSSELARLLPTLVLGPESVDLLLGPPALRRRFLNWGLFHVKHDFTRLWDEANRCLRQRNQVLRRVRVDRDELRTWSVQLADLSQQIDIERRNYIESFQVPFQALVSRISEIKEVALEYYPGWSQDSSLLDLFEKDAESDQKRGFTQKGFQRADVRITISGKPATQVCSRGELKALVWSMVLTQGSLTRNVENKDTLFLIDDLASEFDQAHRRRLGDYLVEQHNQVIITGVDQSALEDCCGGRFDTMFHVKHGELELEQ